MDKKYIDLILQELECYQTGRCDNHSSESCKVCVIKTIVDKFNITKKK